jgi:hypothetical protein
MRCLSALLRVSAILVTFVSLTAGADGATAAMNTLKSLHCELSKAATSTDSAGDQFLLTLHNLGKQPLWLLRRNTPLEPMLSDHLRVSRNGKMLTYIGPMAKRAAPTAQEYVQLAAGARIEQRFNVSRGYDIAPRGRYRIAWSGEFIDARVGTNAPTPDDLSPHRASCKALRFTQ